MTRSTRPKNTPVSVRMSPQRRQQLEKRAAGMSLSGYINLRLFGPEADSEARRTRGNFPVKDHRTLAGILALLGQSEIAASLRELAALARNGCLLVTPDTETTIQEACRDIAAIKAMTIRALGLEP
jgi:hypothetical protein